MSFRYLNNSTSNKSNQTETDPNFRLTQTGRSLIFSANPRPKILFNDKENSAKSFDLFVKYSQEFINSQLALIHSNTRPSFSKYFEKFKDLPSIPESKKTLLLDLDETLIHSLLSNPEKGFFKVRPFVKELLEFASKNFELMLFTAATQEYAEQVLKKLDPHDKLFTAKFYRQDCIKTSIGYIKDLRILKNRNMKNIILVDNSILSFAYQLANGIPILSWYGDTSDTELLKLIDFLKVVNQMNDVRHIIQHTFHILT